MAAYRRFYDSRHLQADCQEPGSAVPEPLRSVIEYGPLLPFFISTSGTSESQKVKKFYSPKVFGNISPATENFLK